MHSLPMQQTRRLLLARRHWRNVSRLAAPAAALHALLLLLNAWRRQCTPLFFYFFLFF
jgi:hypothetical protein